MDPVERAPSGCGVQGCLFGAVGLFVILLVGLLVLAAVRFRDRPSSEDVQTVGFGARAPAGGGVDPVTSRPRSTRGPTSARDAVEPRGDGGHPRPEGAA